MDYKSFKADSLRDAWLPSLVLPVGTVQPSLILLSVSASFLCAFSLTFCFVGSFPKAQQLQPCLAPSLGVINTF